MSGWLEMRPNPLGTCVQVVKVTVPQNVASTVAPLHAFGWVEFSYHVPLAFVHFSVLVDLYPTYTFKCMYMYIHELCGGFVQQDKYDEC